MLSRLLHWSAVLGPIAFFATGRYVLAVVAGLVYLVSLLSTWAMRAIAQGEARVSTYLQAKGEPLKKKMGREEVQLMREHLTREQLALFERAQEDAVSKEIRERHPAFTRLRELLREKPDLESDSPEVQALLHFIPVVVTSAERERIPDRLALIDMVTTLTALAFAVWGTVTWLW